MSSLKAFAALTSQDRRLFLRTLGLVAAVRIGLFLLSFKTLQRLTSRPVFQGSPLRPVGRCVWAVRAASRYVPRATCLTQALVGQRILAASGYESRIEIGVAKDERRRFLAHAWVVCSGEIVIGQEQAGRYIPIAAWNANFGGTRS
jgi:hypothetical protein